MTITLYQKSQAPPADQVACLQHLLADVIILRLRRPGDHEVACLETDVRTRLRTIRGLPPKPPPQMSTQLELPFADLPPPRLPRKRFRRKPG
jgi:hypothetical protein